MPINPISDPPRFCTRCVQSRPSTDRDLCFRCGETLVNQGYCQVCAQYWLLAQGIPCPKHELPLESPPQVLGPDSEHSSTWVTVKTYSHPFEAEASRLRLEAEGIPTFLDGSRMGTNTLYHVATGGIKLQVPTLLVDDARVLLAQSWSMPPVDDLDDAWEDLGAAPGDIFTYVAFRIAVVPILLGLVLIAIFGYIATSR